MLPVGAKLPATLLPFSVIVPEVEETVPLKVSTLLLDVAAAEPDVSTTSPPATRLPLRVSGNADGVVTSTVPLALTTVVAAAVAPPRIRPLWLATWILPAGADRLAMRATEVRRPSAPSMAPMPLRVDVPLAVRLAIAPTISGVLPLVETLPNDGWLLCWAVLVSPLVPP